MPDSFVRNVPTSELRRLEFLVGNFAGNDILFPPDAPAIDFHAHARGDWEACDRHLHFEFFAQVPGIGPETMRILFTYSREQEAYLAWVFSPSQMEPIKFKGSLDGERLVLVSEPSQSRWGMVRLRYTYEVMGEEGIRILGERWEPDGYVRHRNCVLQRMGD